MDDIRPTPPELGACSGVLTLELDLGRSRTDGIPPAPLTRAEASRVADTIAADLGRLVPDLTALGLVVPGALYDQTELMRPGFPLLTALEDVFRGTLRDASFQPQLVALGSDDGRAFSLAALNPERRPGSGPLLMLPFTFVGPRERIGTLAGQLENDLLQRGSASPATRRTLESAFGVQAVNLSYATVGDLCALLKVQLESVEFGGLWELLEHAFFRREGPCDVTLPTGNRFVFDGERVWTPFFSFDDWAQIGPGAATPGDALMEGYVAWAKRQRQYLAALATYRLPVQQVLGEGGGGGTGSTLATLRAASRLDGDYVVETVVRVEGATAEHRLLITNQFDDDVGTLAYTVAALDGAGHLLALEHHYPLSSQGLAAIADRLTRRSEHIIRQVLHPGGLIVSAAGRCLESAPDGGVPAPRRH